MMVEPAALLRAAAVVAVLAMPWPARAAGLREGFQAALALSPELRALEAQRGVVIARRGGGCPGGLRQSAWRCRLRRAEPSPRAAPGGG